MSDDTKFGSVRWGMDQMLIKNSPEYLELKEENQELKAMLAIAKEALEFAETRFNARCYCGIEQCANCYFAPRIREALDAVLGPDWPKGSDDEG